MAMNTNILLYEETKSLRAQNERKIKKRAKRNANSGTDTIICVQEGQERVQQLDTQVEEQVDRVPRQRAPRPLRRRGAIGHTIRTALINSHLFNW